MHILYITVCTVQVGGVSSPQPSVGPPALDPYETHDVDAITATHMHAHMHACMAYAHTHTWMWMQSQPQRTRAHTHTHTHTHTHKLNTQVEGRPAGPRRLQGGHPAHHYANTHTRTCSRTVTLPPCEQVERATSLILILIHTYAHNVSPPPPPHTHSEDDQPD